MRKQFIILLLQIGMASYYGGIHHGRVTASGKRFNDNALTAAHKTLPFGTKVKVTNLENNKSTNVTIIDRGPFVKGRIIDLSKEAARQINIIKKGVGKVNIEVINND